jgi:5-methyltetrahydropteroyltriglutamate--homocysteine methyltransferase
VGSLLRPQNLKDARAKVADGKMSKDELRAIEDAAIADAVKFQEDVGLKTITDGEFRRQSWSGDFLSAIENVNSGESKLTVRFHSKEGNFERTPPGFRIDGKVGLPPEGIFLDAFKYVQSKCGPDVTPKLTIPSPTMLHMRGGRDAVDKAAYPQMQDFFDGLAGVYRAEVDKLAGAGCKFLQIDDTNWAYLCDPNLRKDVENNIHEDPDQVAHTYAKLINASIKNRPDDMSVYMHVCRGNSSSMWVAEGGYEPVAEVLFGEIDIDGYLLEFDSPRAGDFSPLRHLPKGNKWVVLGLVSTKYPELESKDELKRRIDEAAKYVPLEQLALSPQCGFSSTAMGNKVTMDDQRRKLERVVEVAQEVWG